MRTPGGTGIIYHVCSDGHFRVELNSGRIVDYKLSAVSNVLGEVVVQNIERAPPVPQVKQVAQVAKNYLIMVIRAIVYVSKCFRQKSGLQTLCDIECAG